MRNHRWQLSLATSNPTRGAKRHRNVNGQLALNRHSAVSVPVTERHRGSLGCRMIAGANVLPVLIEMDQPHFDGDAPSARFGASLQAAPPSPAACRWQ